MIRMLARAMQKEERADSMLRWRAEVMTQIKKVSDKIPEEDKPRVIFLYNYDKLTVGGEKCYEGFCMNLTGGINMGEGLGMDRAVNVEQILAWNPDIILFGGWHQALKAADIYQNPVLKEVGAVKNGKVFKLPQWASSESPLTWFWMANVFHPDRFNFDLRQEIKSVYKRHYRVNLTESDVDFVLFL